MRAELGIALLLVACDDRTYVLAPLADAAVGDDYGTPVALAALSSADSKDDDPAATADLLALVFDSQRAGGQGREDIWASERSSVTADWQPPVVRSELNSEHRETGIALSSDGLHIWFSSDRPGGPGGLDVYTAARSHRAEPFAAPKLVAELSSPGDDLVSDVDPEHAWLARRTSDDDDYDLYVAARSAGGFGAPQPLDTLNSAAEESDLCAIAAGESVVFTRDGDLILARRTGPNAYQEVGPLTTLNSSHDDRDAWFSPDRATVLFASNRSGSYQLYEATR